MSLISRKEFVVHKVAVITIEVDRTKGEPRLGEGKYSYEWFDSIEEAREWLSGWNKFCQDDALGHGPWKAAGPPAAYAHLNILCVDTTWLTVASADVFPSMKMTHRWRQQVLANLGDLFED